MAFYSIGEVAERCGINPVTLRAWQRRYGLLKPQRSEGGHRQFDEEDILRIEEIKRWIERGVSVGKVKALLEDNLPAARDESAHLQEEMMSILRYMQPARIRAKLMALSHQHPVDTLIDSLLVPVRQRLKLDQNTSLAQPLAGAGLQHPFSRPKLSAPIRGADQGLSAGLQVNLAPGFERFAAADIKKIGSTAAAELFNQIQPDLINGFYMQV